MVTEFCRITKESEEEIYCRAGEIIRRGGLVAFPTETVYGLGGDALNPHASAKIYEAKGRPSDNPLIVHIASIDDLEKIVDNIPENAKKLADKFWPGPLTMILNKKNIVPKETTGGLETVAVRMPNHEIALKFIKSAGGYIAAPSANTSGRPSPTKAEHVNDDLSGKIDMILDGGPVGIGVESTIIDLTSDIPMILRPGYITVSMIQNVITDEVKIDPTITEKVNADFLPKAPGMKYKHYAPKGELFIIRSRDESKVIGEIKKLTRENLEKGKKVGILTTVENIDVYDAGIVKSVGSRAEEETIARNLFSVLREFDAENVSVIFSEEFDTPQLGMAVMNRLLKAAAHKVIDV